MLTTQAMLTLAALNGWAPEAVTKLKAALKRWKSRKFEIEDLVEDDLREQVRAEDRHILDAAAALIRPHSAIIEAVGRLETTIRNLGGEPLSDITPRLDEDDGTSVYRHQLKKVVHSLGEEKTAELLGIGLRAIRNRLVGKTISRPDERLNLLFVLVQFQDLDCDPEDLRDLLNGVQTL